MKGQHARGRLCRSALAYKPLYPFCLQSTDRPKSGGCLSYSARAVVITVVYCTVDTEHVLLQAAVTTEAYCNVDTACALLQGCPYSGTATGAGVRVWQASARPVSALQGCFGRGMLGPEPETIPFWPAGTYLLWESSEWQCGTWAAPGMTSSWRSLQLTLKRSWKAVAS